GGGDPSRSGSAGRLGERPTRARLVAQGAGGRPGGAMTFVLVGGPMSEVQPEAVQWLWAGRIPRGKLTIIDGDPGLAKSLLTLDVAARVTTGRAMPDGSPGMEGTVLV